MSIFNDHEADNALIRATVKGDEQAFGLLYQKYNHYVLRCARAILDSDPASAWDVMQDTFIKARKALAGYSPLNFAGWLRTIAQHLAINLLRDRRRRDEILSQDTALFTDSLYEDPYEALVRKRIRIKASEAVDRLPKLHQEILLLWAAGHLYKEIAEMLSVPLGTVMSRINRAKNAVMKEPLERSAA